MTVLTRFYLTTETGVFKKLGYLLRFILKKVENKLKHNALEYSLVSIK